jgi:hypothetical protein
MWRESPCHLVDDGHASFAHNGLDETPVDEARIDGRLGGPESISAR